MSEEKEEKEICIDLSKKIKFSDKVYVSLGTLLLSVLAMIISWLCKGAIDLYDLWYLILSIRSGTFDDDTVEEAKEILEEEKGNENE